MLVPFIMYMNDRAKGRWELKKKEGGEEEKRREEKGGGLLSQILRLIRKRLPCVEHGQLRVVK
jgi:hypothetical protein